MSAKSGVLGQFYIQDNSTTDTFSDEASTLQADNRTVIINDATYKSFKNDKSLFTIKKDAVEVTAPYDLYLDRVIFKTEQAAGTWTISGTYTELEIVGGCYEWSIDMKNGVNDNTAFGDTWESDKEGILNWIVTAKRHWCDNEFFDNTINYVIRLFWDIDNLKSWYGLAKFTDIKDGQKVKGMTESDVTLKGQGLLIQTSHALPSI